MTMTINWLWVSQKSNPQSQRQIDSKHHQNQSRHHHHHLYSTESQHTWYIVDNQHAESMYLLVNWKNMHPHSSCTYINTRYIFLGILQTNDLFAQHTRLNKYSVCMKYEWAMENEMTNGQTSNCQFVEINIFKKCVHTKRWRLHMYKYTHREPMYRFIF